MGRRAIAIVGSTGAVATAALLLAAGGPGFAAGADATALSADLTISKTDSADPIAPGGAFTYTISVENVGPDAATGVQVTDTLPTGVTLLSTSTTQGTCSDAAGVVTCNVGDLALSGLATIAIVVTAPSTETTLTNTAGVTSDADPQPANNSATQQTVVAVPVPELSISDVSQAEGNAGSSGFVFTVTKSATDAPATVQFATADGTAGQPGDYAASSGTVSFAAGEATKQVTVNVSGDAAFEADETFFVNLSSPTGASIADNQGQGTISNDDASPSLAINDVTLKEGNSGTTAFTFTVTKTGATELPASVNFATANGTATAPTDYAAQSGTLTFAAGEATKTITILVNGETAVEANETFLVNLSNASGATIADAQGLGTIENDDASLAIDNVIVAEGNSGTAALVFTVRKTGAAVPASVGFATGNGTASSASDYESEAGTVNFAAADVTRTITVRVDGDTTFETDETLYVTLSNAIGATIADNQAEGTIANDDTAPTLAVNDVAVAEGNAGTTALTFLVTKTGPTELSASVFYETGNGTATAPDDYAAQRGTVVFAAGDTSKVVTVLVSGDTAFEANETFVVNLSIPGGATLADNQGQGTIVSDDGMPTLAINDVSRAEGDAGITEFTFTITKSSTNSPATVAFGTANGAASSPDDYADWTGTLSFAPTETSKTLTVFVNGDTSVEPDENFFVNLTNASGATIADSQGVGTIQKDDTAVRPPASSARCVVPNVKAKSVRDARTLLVARRCTLGRVTYASSRRVKKGKTISQSKPPGTRHPRGTRVNVVVSRGKP